ncbi:3-oxoacyl-[acyl-carrier-protein] reductase-like [Maniola hyperantus]|uniref:3-oxoacyl-[acyl-carrier-protein] reductase-like n=1 Tax=Aphantopus hyperantus TaxID=2795564 RepID=UPI001569F540|nr:3-oxoacyl-[acyl-carrier-protein] reductase-like [Maniola hyperantus]
MSFTNKVVIVTGASSGIGAAVAIAFSAAGAKVAIVGRNESKLASVAARCSNPLVIRADITKDEDARAVIAETVKKFGKLDILINNAGLTKIASILQGDMMKAYDSIMDINVRALVQLTTLAAPYLLKTKGNIVNISSIAAVLTPVYPGGINYCVSKAAVTHFGACAAVEFAPHGVRVNTVSPGPVKTDFIENAKVPITWDDHKKYNSLKRISEPEEIADLVLFLASDKAKGITGSNFVSDNGSIIKR